jgi:hypothetical protein
MIIGGAYGILLDMRERESVRESENERDDINNIV